MAVRARPTRRWLGPLVVAAVCLAGVGGGFGRSSASPVAASAGRPAAHVQAKTPRSPRLPDTKALVSGVVGLATSARDARAKVNLTVPTVIAVAYLDPTYRTPASQVVPAPRYDLPAHPKPGCTYNAAILYGDLDAVHITQPNKKKPGVVTSVGRFPASHVSALAFGSIPVTATLHTRQIRRHGKLVPLTADTVTAFTSTPAGPSGACDTRWDSGGPQSPPAGTVSHGSLAVRISDVRVDKQPVDVGRHCHTVSPLQLNLWGRSGYILYTGGVLEQQYDRRTVHAGPSVYPLHPGSQNLTLPAFAGCIDPATGEDYSRLLTATVSGPNGTLAVHQSTAVLNGISNKNVTVCMPGGQGCVKRPSPVLPPKPGMTVRAHH